jgi:hypothetical protein
MAFLGEKVNAHKDQDVRRAMHALTRVADETGAAILVVRHLNKSGGQNAVTRGGGSIGIIGAARLGLIVGKDPEDDSRRILAVSKSNLGKEAKALAYRLVDDEERGVARIDWEGETGHSTSDLLAEEYIGDRSAVDEACEILRDTLADGPLTANDVTRVVRDAGVAQRTLDRAKARLGVKSKKVGKERWLWGLPDDESQENREEDMEGCQLPNIGDLQENLLLGDSENPIESGLDLKNAKIAKGYEI